MSVNSLIMSYRKTSLNEMLAPIALVIIISYLLAIQLDEQVATLHLPVLGAALTVFAGDHAIVVLPNLKAFSGLKNEIHLLSKHLVRRQQNSTFLRSVRRSTFPLRLKPIFSAVELEGPFSSVNTIVIEQCVIFSTRCYVPFRARC